jgi:hypothetical protein
MTVRAATIVAVCVGVVPLAAQGDGVPAGSAHIRGRVIAAAGGAPVAGARIALEATRLLNTPLNSLRRATTTDATGAFEFPELASGDYVLTTTKTGYLTRISGRNAVGGGETISVRDRQVLSNLTIPLLRGGAINGRIVDALGEPVARVQVQALRYQYASDGSRTPVAAGFGDTTDDLGQFRVYGLPAGDFVVVANGGSITTAAMLGQFTTAREVVTTAPTYFPGTTNAAEAQVVSLASGAEATVDFAVSQARLVGISGTAVRSNGAPAAGLMATLRASVGDSVSARAPVPVAADGTFRIANVAPGQYWIDVEGWRPETAIEAASVPIAVSTEDLAITVVTSPGTTIRGRVVFEGAARGPATFRVRASRTGNGGRLLRRVGDEGEVTANGSFEIRGASGRVLLTSDRSGWVVKSVLVNGDETVDEGLDVSGHSVIDGVRVVVTNRLSTISGRVSDARGRPLGTHAVVMLRTDATGGPAGQRIRVHRPDADGRFSDAELRAGSWVVGAVADLEANSPFSPEFQQRLRDHGQRVTLGEAESVAVEIQPTPNLQ